MPSAQRPEKPQRDRVIIGCMTGTSMDALDAAAVVVRGRALRIRADLLDHVTLPLADLATGLRALASGESMPAATVAAMAQELGALHARAVEALRRRVGRIDLVVAHGQTVHHAPPLTWQLLNPWPIALAGGCPVLCDLRGASVAEGGEGAPITPLADWVLFRSDSESVAVVNLGGFCNVTTLGQGRPAHETLGRDICACNQLLDGVARRTTGMSFDEHGALASIGTSDAKALDALLESLRSQAASRRSLGSGDEAGAWIESWAGSLKPEDMAATAVEAVASTIAASVRGFDRVLCAGGGVRNVALMRALERHCDGSAEPTDVRGTPAHLREAVAMAVLGALCQDGVAITLPGIVGGGSSLRAGAWINACIESKGTHHRTVADS